MTFSWCTRRSQCPSMVHTSSSVATSAFPLSRTLSVVPLVLFSTLLFVLGLAHSPGSTLAADAHWSLWVTVGPYQQLSRLACCRDQLGEGIAQGEEETGTQSNSGEVTSLIHSSLFFFLRRILLMPCGISKGSLPP